ncbi:poly(R)-hydroxyalkanoic acid synthase subunit PhaE [Sporosarcina sp. G11-34]|uniref:poly(R)-hydroxyalkanoic acid synthase subunit PhaE n=1 Tax=Sporosarcina sp. G11-34 TaxID=2849605 RepID=UPI0022A972BF|nr:poly(R)-hydroxyalkanoic acid synthase subunit PhaE [Sporosarcina sp. G11-34]MCZ2258308.1 polyhydroxyalkanoate biosynthesis repressor PhaR [Sporosarcina sp. G11-34]
MPHTKLMDPFTMWKDVYEKTEATWSEAIQETMKKESFSEGMGQTLNSHLQSQELISKMTEAYLKQVNMPTRGEVASVASLVINLEEKVDDLQDSFEDDTLKNEIGQLKRAVANLDKKIDSVIDLVGKITDQKPVPVGKGK